MRTSRGGTFERGSLLACLKVSERLLKKLDDPESGVRLASGWVLPRPFQEGSDGDYLVVLFACEDESDLDLVEHVVHGESGFISHM
jgi:hypothetical protein